MNNELVEKARAFYDKRLDEDSTIGSVQLMAMFASEQVRELTAERGRFKTALEHYAEKCDSCGCLASGHHRDGWCEGHKGAVLGLRCPCKGFQSVAQAALKGETE